jgi:poly(3-hydroxybutyrate) depolymerase
VLDMPAEYYLDTIKVVFQDFALVNGTWEIDDKPVRPQDIRTTALLTIEGELDDISGAGQTQAAHALCTGVPADRQFHYDVVGAGHYGIFSGRRWREKVYPRVRDFIASHQTVLASQKSAARKVSGAANGKAAGPVNGKANGVAHRAVGGKRKGNGVDHTPAGRIARSR